MRISRGLTTQGYRQGCEGQRSAEVTGEQQYWTSRPEAGARPDEVTLLLPDIEVVLQTDSGVFSAGHVDRGTRFLLMEGARPPVLASELLDLGCGYGPIACTLAMRSPESRVWAIDVNERALDLCRRNAAAAGLNNVIVAKPDDMPNDVVFDAIWSNPPIRVGKAALHDLLTTWLDRLVPGGAAHLVVQRHLGSDSLARWLTGEGWSTQRRASRKGFRILDVAAR
ncbi:MAG TPA: MFS transporter [Acidimicrobiaceae bacterium]|nr:MFS transporter [Acidimicrobiaceae bacterium]HCV36044.1 MFS transporter [Acidimicrobiaceae bacterium]|tara:strand:+ start:6323 stop:6997 length:675 start_codon:yes stop_codon:yes gene_type:complete